MDDELRLPRVPGVIRRFWARHPLLADILVALICLALNVVPAATFRIPTETGRGPSPAALVLVPLTVCACVMLLRRRQWPTAVFVGAIILDVAFLLAGTGTGSMLGLVTSYSLAVYRSTRAAWMGFGIGLGALGVVAFWLGFAGVVAPSDAANSVIGTGGMLLIGTLIGVNVGNRKRYVEAIIARSRQLLVERDQQAQLAASAERSRIAREMHDIVSHSLTVIVALSEGATATRDQDRARAATAQVADTARAALLEMRAMLGVLRDDSASAPLTPVGEDAVSAVVESARAAGYPVVFRQESTAGTIADLPRSLRLAVARIVQEGVTNAMRHAPAARRIDVLLRIGAREVVVEVRNDGVVGVPSTGGYGLRGLRERVDHVGGELDVGPLPPGSWRVRARLPIEGDRVRPDTADPMSPEERP